MTKLLLALALACVPLLAAAQTVAIPSVIVIQSRQTALRPPHPTMTPCQIRRKAARNPQSIPNC
ncbi:hypothetical protein [Methylocystis heyeri]|uniref:Uncharacterized protein n=1 Tax=Methylocystis heyeri TaxID=391905 RepID=A0A6B8KEN1_9HYPH|nr:hypothetical protein [Methylocystis heyeri]QGM46746.1 hypothetical protein H2LOC_014165 [Methylocystis heyeri]